MQQTVYPLICIFDKEKPAENFVDSIKTEHLVGSEAYPSRFSSFWDFVHIFTPEAASQATILGQNMINHKIPLETAELCMQEIRTGHSVVLFYPSDSRREKAQQIAAGTGARLFSDPQQSAQELLKSYLPADKKTSSDDEEKGNESEPNDPLDKKEGTVETDITHASTQLEDPEHLR